MKPMSAAELMAKGGQTNMLEGRRLTLKEHNQMTDTYQPGEDGRLALTSLSAANLPIPPPIPPLPTLPRACWFNVAKEWFPGTLHMWGTDSTDLGSYPVGVVEDETGKVHSLYVEYIKMVKP